MQIYKAPEKIPVEHNFNQKKIFLAGSINMGKATPWQNELTNLLKNIQAFKDAVILNPRRDDWDSTWEQTLENEKFVEQVNWEISAMELADIIFMVFDAEGESPITLLELGLHARNNKLFVCCPPEFWRSGNVYVTCERFGIPYVKSFKELKRKLKKVK